jgi:hypothetical protein
MIFFIIYLTICLPPSYPEAAPPLKSIATGFWIVLSYQGTPAVSDLQSRTKVSSRPAYSLPLAMLVAWTVAGCIFFEVCNGDVKHRLRGEKKVSSWYIPFFLLRIGCLCLLLELGIYPQLNRMFYPVMGVELIYFVALLFRPSYLSVLHKVCSSIVETPAIFALMLPLVHKYFNL